MPKIPSFPIRNVEIIRRKNVEDNRTFLESLRLNNARSDFVSSARSILPQRKHVHHTYEKVDRTTRYNEKVKSGEIGPFVPEWQRLLEEKKEEAAKRLLEKQRRKEENEKRKQVLLLEKEKKKLEFERKKQEYEKRKRELFLEKQKRKQELLLERQRQRKEKEEEILFRRELIKIEDQLKYEEKEKIRRGNRPPPEPSKWGEFFKDNPYSSRRLCKAPSTYKIY